MRTGDEDPQKCMFEICDVVSEIEAICDDHFAGGKYSPNEALTKIYDVVHEKGHLRARHTVRYIPEDMPDDEDAPPPTEATTA